MKYLLGILIMAFSLSAMAIDLNGLSEEQKAQLALQAAQMKTQVKTQTVETVSKWVNIGKDLGSGLNATAKELGITANELAVTPVGMFAMVLIAWNYIGNDIVGVIFGFFWLSTVVPIWVWMYRSRFVIEKIEIFAKDSRDDGLRKRKTYQTSNTDDTVHFFYWFTLMISILIGFLSIVL